MLHLQISLYSRDAERVCYGASHEDQPELTSQLQNKYHLSVYLDNGKQILYQGVSWILKQLFYKSLLNPCEESIWSHFPTVVLLATSWLLQQTLFMLLVWDGVQPSLFERLDVPLIRVYLAWLSTNATVCGRRPRKRGERLIGQHCANRTNEG